ncbi:O-antigen ligase family protein [Maribacter sp. SA7]|uniref:O-antigen ligase family protein n=1 Tax=Maribacter zhoushanensis TaxID=3030012 RepID=UPI0023EE2069|nr:O-antigen ligase family protein [Maribacter zhoushanensis]MDF4201835.1 O-antigen ligase family protein [Maribacter zhoushanensis]
MNFTFYTALGQNTFDEATGLIRYPGMFSESQYNGQFLALSSFLFMIMDKSKNKNQNYLIYFGFVLFLIAIVLAGSRSALGGFVLGCIFLVSISSIRIKLYTILSFVFGTFAFYLYKPDSGIFGRAENLGDDLSFRQSIWTETSFIIDKYPMLGIGFGNFESYLMKYHQDMYLQIESDGELIYFTQPENGYLKILVEQGYLAFIIFILLLAIPFFQNIYLAVLGKLPRYKGFVMAGLISWIVAFNTVYSFLDYRLLVMVASFTVILIIPPHKSSGVKSK